MNASRNLAIKVRELQHPNTADVRMVRNLIVAFSQGMKGHLRVEEPFGVHEDHLGLERITHVIDRSVSELFLDEA